MAHGAFEVAKAYITYRYTRTLVRQSNTTDDKILSLIECNNEEAKQENSNKNPVVNSTQRDYMAGEVSRDITTRILLPADIVEAHNAVSYTHLLPLYFFIREYPKIVCLIVGGIFTINDQMTLSQLLVYIQLLAYVNQPFLTLSSIFGSVRRLLVQLRTVDGLLGLPQERLETEASDSDKGDTSIAVDFQNVCFRYDEKPEGEDDNGGRYIPVSYTHLDVYKRQAYILQDTQASLILTNRSACFLEEAGFSVVDIRDEKVFPDKPSRVVGPFPTDIAYIIYTSGSTGQPKGVVVSHRSLANYISFARRQYVRGPEDVFALYSPLSFDLTVTSLYTPLSCGSSIQL